MTKLKYFSIYLLLLLLILTSFNCESTTSSYPGSPTDTNKTQEVYIWAKHNKDSIEYTDVEGIVAASNMNTLQFEYLEIEDSRYLNSTYRRNYISFNNFRVYSPPETINVEIKTSVGTLSGNIGLPKNPRQISVSPSDSLGLKDSLHFSWSDGEADAYNITGGYYFTIDTTDGVITQNYTIDTTVTSNSLTFPSNKFQYPGVIFDLNISSLNTPDNPNKSGGNMTGKGEGYLFYNADSKRISKNIIIGSGPENTVTLTNSSNSKHNTIPKIIKDLSNQ